jgi:hypothetical protein
MSAWVGQGKEGAGPGRENSVDFNLNKFDPIKNWLYLDKKNSNKTQTCRELNMEQLSPLQFSKFGLEFELKI